jgi:hypothetical protein
VGWLGNISLLALTLMVLLGLNFGSESIDWTSPKVLVVICVGVGSSAVFLSIEPKYRQA